MKHLKKLFESKTIGFNKEVVDHVLQTYVGLDTTYIIFSFEIYDYGKGDYTKDPNNKNPYEDYINMAINTNTDSSLGSKFYNCLVNLFLKSSLEKDKNMSHAFSIPEYLKDKMILFLKSQGFRIKREVVDYDDRGNMKIGPGLRKRTISLQIDDMNIIEFRSFIENFTKMDESIKNNRGTNSGEESGII